MLVNISILTPVLQDDASLDTMLRVGSGERSPNSSNNKDDTKKEGEMNFMHAFVAALSMIIVTELGDKTFFIAAIMAMNHARLTVFAGAMLALTIMHIVSCESNVLFTELPCLPVQFVVKRKLEEAVIL